MLLLRASIGVFIFLAAVAPFPAAADSGEGSLPTYSIIDLGTLGGSISVGNAINDVGQVVGSADRLFDHRRAYIWENGVMTDLGVLPQHDQSTASDINNLGDVVGISGVGTPILWSQGEMINLGGLTGTTGSGTSPKAINDAGQVVGISGVSIAEDHAFLWQDGVMIDLGTFGGRYSIGWDINQAGQVVGGSSTGSAEHAFLWENGVMTDLGTLGGTTSVAYGINDQGQIVGKAGRSDHAVMPFLWEDGEMTDLGTPLGLSSGTGRAINNSGQILCHWFVYDSVSGAFDRLRELIPTDRGWSDLNGWDINDAGQIVGTGTYWGHRHAFLMTPAQFGRCCYRAAESPICKVMTEEECNAAPGPRFYTPGVACSYEPGEECPTDCNDNGVPDPEEADGDNDGLIDDCDPCPADPDNDADGDGVCGDLDGCPDDPNKIDPGACGCGQGGEGDDDGDGVADCIDVCVGVDDMIFAPECEGPVPTASHWGLVVLTLLLLAGGKICFSRRRRAV